MHYGSINNPRSKAGRIYRFLQMNRGVFFSGWDLTLKCQTSAISTRISEINTQLRENNADEEVKTDPRVINGQRKWFYGLVDIDNSQLLGM